MQIYIALLRGINVGGQKKIKMVDLRAYLQELNFQAIQTYVQSGNILFQYENSSIEELEKSIHDKILEKYGFEVPVMIIQPQVLQQVIEQNPFTEADGRDLKRLYVTFLSDAPTLDRIEKLKEVDYSPEEYLIQNKHIYLYSPNNYGKAKISNNFFEKKLKVAATTRNWRTVNKLLELTQ